MFTSLTVSVNQGELILAILPAGLGLRYSLPHLFPFCILPIIQMVRELTCLCPPFSHSQPFPLPFPVLPVSSHLLSSRFLPSPVLFLSPYSGDTEVSPGHFWKSYVLVTLYMSFETFWPLSAYFSNTAS